MRCRYAIYFVPEQSTALYKLGSALLGYDTYTGQKVAAPILPLPQDLSLEELTAKPSPYGLHATVVAPFFLCGIGEDEFLKKAEFFCRSVSNVTLPRVEVVGHRGFMALRPAIGEQREWPNEKKQTNEQLQILAAEAVRFFFPMRAPLDLAEIRRRLNDELSTQQTENLREWGYPYIFDEYDFHMTLTGAVPQSSTPTLQAVLAEYFAEAEANPLHIDHLCVCCQPVLSKNGAGEKNTGRFTVLERFALKKAKNQGRTL